MFIDPAIRFWMPMHLMLCAHPSLRGRLPGGEDGLKSLENMGLDGLRELHRLHPGRQADIFPADYPEWADKEIRACERAGISLVISRSPAYPPGLLRLNDPPVLLYMKGELLPEDAGAVAVVGSRAVTPYGERAAIRLGRDLAGAGVTVVSGLARGVDAAAHRGALQEKGRTLAVLGTGLLRVYPSENRTLASQVAASGALITEYPLDAAPLAHHFPVRNRILAALSEGVVVVEAARDSGSLITARLAADIGVCVGAVPGSIFSRTSMGCNDLIYDGAVPVRRADDILSELPAPVRERIHARKTRPDSGADEEGEVPGGLSAGERRVLQALSNTEPQSAGELAQSLQLASGVLLGHLLELEIRGLALRTPADLFLRT